MAAVLRRTAELKAVGRPSARSVDEAAPQSARSHQPARAAKSGAATRCTLAVVARDDKFAVPASAELTTFERVLAVRKAGHDPRVPPECIAGAPRVIQVYDFGLDEADPYYTMECSTAVIYANAPRCRGGKPAPCSSTSVHRSHCCTRAGSCTVMSVRATSVALKPATPS